MNYKKIYDNLVFKAKSANRKKLKRDDLNYIYYEQHHIIPKCLGGLNNKENLVLFTAKEHFVAHKLLVEIYPNNEKIFHAINLMVHRKRFGRIYKVSANEYERIKSQQSKLMSDRNASGAMGMKDKFHSEETKARLKRDRKGQWTGDKNPQYGKPELNPMYGSHRVGELNPFFNKHHTQETCDHIGKLKRERPLVVCLYCNKELDECNAKKWHFDNCKQNPDYTPKEIICPHCGKIGTSVSNMKKHHFDNCKLKPKQQT